MKYRKFLAAMALASGFAAQPALAEDLTLEFVVWNYSLETIQDNVKQFEAANPGIKVKVTDYAWPDYHDSLILRLQGQYADGCHLWRPGLAAGVGRRRFHRAAQLRCAEGHGRRVVQGHRRLRAHRRDL